MLASRIARILRAIWSWTTGPKLTPEPEPDQLEPDAPALCVNTVFAWALANNFVQCNPMVYRSTDYGLWLHADFKWTSADERQETMCIFRHMQHGNTPWLVIEFEHATTMDVISTLVEMMLPDADLIDHPRARRIQ